MMAQLYRVAFFVVFLSLMAYPSGSRALDLGLTPSHVFSLWTNINRSLIASSRLVSNGIELSVMLKAMKPEDSGAQVFRDTASKPSKLGGPK